MNKTLLISVAAAFFAAGCAATAPPAYAQASTKDCEAEKLRLRIGPRRMRLLPAKGPKCLPVASPASINTTFDIEIQPKPDQNVVFPDGSVRVMNSPDSALKPAGSLTFSGANVGNMITVTVTGSAAFDDTDYFDIIADGIGTLDPRIRVVEDVAFRRNLRARLLELRKLYELLVTEYEADNQGELAFTSDEFIERVYGLSKEEVDSLIREYAGTE